MRVSQPKPVWARIACLGLWLWPIFLFAQSPSPTQNLSDCKNGLPECNRSSLTQAQLAEVARADQQRNLSNCRYGFDSCNRSKLSAPEATALAVADHQRNLSDCN